MSVFSSMGGRKPFYKKSVGTTLLAGLVGTILFILELLFEPKKNK